MKSNETWVCTSTILVPKKSSGTEDGLHIGRWFAVLDGVSTGVVPKGGVLGTKTPGQYARDVGLASIAQAEKRGMRSADIVPFLSEELRMAVEEKWRGTEIIGPAFTFALFIPEEHLIVRVGDCPYLIDGKGNNPGLAFDAHKAEIRKGIIEKRLEGGSTEEALLKEDPTAQLMDYLTQNEQPQYRNKDHPRFGYGVVNGEHVPSSVIEFIAVPENAERVVLTTDGYPDFIIRGTAEETHREHLALLERDPLCYKEWVAVRGVYPGFTIPDDCSGLWLERK
jgi:hypothetical protein